MAIKKIFVYNKPIILTSDAEKYLLDNAHSAHFLFLRGGEARNFRSALQHLEQASSYGVVIEDESVDGLLSILKKTFHNIIAGGGVVVSEHQSLLMIHRRGKWDLPKGKLELGEDIETCAIREVKEETGLQEVKITKALEPSYHLYHDKDEVILKVTYWFLMSASENQSLNPDITEQITEVKWISPQKQDLYLSETFESIKEVVKNSNL